MRLCVLMESDKHYLTAPIELTGNHVTGLVIEGECRLVTYLTTSEEIQRLDSKVSLKGNNALGVPNSDYIVSTLFDIINTQYKLGVPDAGVYQLFSLLENSVLEEDDLVIIDIDNKLTNVFKILKSRKNKTLIGLFGRYRAMWLTGENKFQFNTDLNVSTIKSKIKYWVLRKVVLSSIV